MALKTYPNGLRLSVTPREDSKLISVDLHITGGTQSEKNYESGISEFTSRMLLMGTVNHPTQKDLFDYAKNQGMVITSDNTCENIIVSISTMPENLSKAIELLNEIAFESNFLPKSGDIVRNQMLSIVAKLQENTSYTLERMVNQALFYRTGLANPKFGTNTTISRMTANDSKEFLERILTPKNTIISVVGNVDSDEVYEMVIKTFYAKFLEGNDYKKLKYVAEVEGFIGSCRTKNKKLNQSRIFLAFPSINYKSSKKYALEIILPILENVLKEKTMSAHYFHDIKLSTNFYANNGKFTIETMVDCEHVDEFLKLVIDVLKSIKNNGISEQEFKNEKNAYLIKFLESNETVSNFSKNSAKEIAVNKQSYSLASEIMKIELLKISDANSVINQTIDFSKLFIAYIGNPIEIDVNNYLN